jgi:hypothetical protein
MGRGGGCGVSHLYHRQGPLFCENAVYSRLFVRGHKFLMINVEIGKYNFAPSARQESLTVTKTTNCSRTQ